MQLRYAASILSFLRNRSYHSVLIIDFNHDNRGVVSQLTGLPKQLHIIKHQQLIPCWAKCLTQNLQCTQAHITVSVVKYNKHKHILYIRACSFYLGNLAVCGKEDPSKGV